jgi:hypothetical protein
VSAPRVEPPAREALRRTALVGLLAALVAASGYAFAAVPNVKPISLIVFLAGARVGLGGGLVVAGLGMGIYSIANPWGPAPPLVLLAKVAGAMLFAVAGAAIGAPLARRALAPRAALLGAAGFLLTVPYELITNFATAATIGMASRPLPTLVAGIPFAIAHTVSNAAIFAAAGAPLLPRFVGGGRWRG